MFVFSKQLKLIMLNEDFYDFDAKFKMVLNDLGRKIWPHIYTDLYTVE